MNDTSGTWCLREVRPFLFGPNSEAAEHRAIYDRDEFAVEGSLRERCIKTWIEYSSSVRLDIVQRRLPSELDGCR
jgi:hypothetical protein